MEIEIILIEHIIDLEREMIRSRQVKQIYWWIRHEDFYILPSG
jgi:hypothetical protein